MSDMYVIRNGLKKGMFYIKFFNFVLCYTIRIVQVNQKCLKLNGTHYPLFCVVDVNMSGGREQTLKKTSEACNSG